MHDFRVSGSGLLGKLSKKFVQSLSVDILVIILSFVSSVVSLFMSSVLQFTLQCVLKGNKPDFHKAMGGTESEQLYQEFLQQMRAAYRPDAIKGTENILSCLMALLTVFLRSLHRNIYTVHIEKIDSMMDKQTPRQCTICIFITIVE